MDIGSSFTYMFEDESWIKKILIGGIVALVPIVNFAAMGYVVEVIRNVRDGRPTPLPEWDQFGQMWTSGLWLFLIFLVYSIPIIILACISGIATAALGTGLEGASADAIGGTMGIVSTCLSCLMGLWGLVIGVLSPAIMIRFAETGQFNSAFQFGEVVSVAKANVGSYLIVLVLLWVAIYIIGPLGLIACLVGMIFTIFYAYLIAGNLLGQLAAQVRGAVTTT
jgi:hypothetical protein